MIQGLKGARILVQNESDTTIEQTLSTDSYGEALFSDLPTGTYKCRVTASNHQQYTGRLWIKPDVTVTHEAFLSYNLVSVEWEVNEITIEDRYEINLNATYETDVPAPVVIAEPAAINVPEMEAGDVYNGEFTLSNYGLIQAEELEFQLPDDDEYFAYELLDTLPDTLGAKERITVSYRITCLKSPASDGDDNGGGSWFYKKCSKIIYKYECINGYWVKSWQEVCWWHILFWDTAPQLVDSGTIIDLIINIDVTAPDNTNSSGTPIRDEYSPSSETIEGTKCLPDEPRGPEDDPEDGPGSNGDPDNDDDDPDHDDGAPGDNDDDQNTDDDKKNNQKTDTGCSVNYRLREFNDEATDLSVKVPNGRISVKRFFYENLWHWNHERHDLEFVVDSIDDEIQSIFKAGVEYSRSGSDANGNPVYINGSYQITRTQDGFLWKNKHGKWREFSSDGRMIAYGNRNGIIAKLNYQEGDNGELLGISDVNDNQVLWFEYDSEARLSDVYDSENRRVTYSYTDDRLSSVFDVLENKTIYEYDSNGRMIRKVDAGGRPTLASYDSYGNVIAVTDSQGNGKFFEYNYDESTKERYAGITSSSGRIKEVWFDRDGDTKKVSVNGRMLRRIVKDGNDHMVYDEKNNVTRKEYDEWDNLTKIVYPDNSTYTFEYEHTFNKLTKIIDPRGNITTFAYDQNGNMVNKTEAAGAEDERITTYTYDDYGRILSVTIEQDENTEAATISYSYDEKGNLSTITDPESNLSRFPSYDNMGNLLEMMDPRGNTWLFEHDQLGRLASKTDPLNHKTTYEYDGANNQTALVDAMLKRFEFEYDDHNNMVKTIDPYQKFVASIYNTDNLMTRSIDQEGKEHTYEYDNEARIIKSIDGNANEIIYYYDESETTSVSFYKPVTIKYPTFTREFGYDVRQRIVEEVDVLDENTRHSRQYVYDEVGNPITSTDEEGNTTQFEYDGLNRLTKTIDPLNGVTERTYDDRGNLVAITDSNGGTTQYEYDRNNRLVKIIRPMGQQSNFEYDENGNLTTVYDAKGQKIFHTYDQANRRTRTEYFVADDHNTPIKSVDFVHNELGSLVSYDDGATSAQYTYDHLQRKTAETVNYGPFSLSYGYAYFGNGLKKSFTGPDDLEISYDYDSGNRLSAINIPGQGQISYNTYTWISPSKITLPGGSVMDFVYDPLMRINSISSKDSGQNTILTRGYTYSQASNIRTKNTEHGNYAYQYDQLYRLTEAVNPIADDESYTYDALGNRLTAADTTGAWGYNLNNELTGYDDAGFVYDENGNLKQKSAGSEVAKYHYDILNRLNRVEDGDSAVLAEYYYDPFGRRLWKEVGGVRTYFMYSDEGLVGEYDSDGNEIKTYGYVSDSVWTTDPLFLKENGTYYWYQNDQLGAPQKLTDMNGGVVWSANYDSFGNAQITKSEIINNLRLPGQYYDEETGLIYNRFRHYDASIGRYMQSDPLFDVLDLYGYANGNPLILIDPFGLCPVDTVQDIISLGGLIPGLGDPLDLINAGVYAARGKGEEALWSLGSAAPFVGTYIGGIKKTNRTADILKKAAQQAEDLYKETKVGKETAEKMAQKGCQSNAEESIFGDIADKKLKDDYKKGSIFDD